MSLRDVQVIWQPQDGPQTSLISCPVFEVFFGGARGGGKTEGSIGDWFQHSSEYGDKAVGIFVRRKLIQLEEVIARFKLVSQPLGFKYREQPHEFTAPNGARLKFRYLERDADADEYQGHSYTRVYVEEATNFPAVGPIDKLRATLRSPTGVPVGMRLTGNPGGPGHQWVKARYIEASRRLPDQHGNLNRKIDLKRPGPIQREYFKNPFDAAAPLMELERVFIPSKLSDNKKLMEHDPLYVARLQQQGSAMLVKAWLEGDWDIVLGAFFDCWGPQHVLATHEWLHRIPLHAPRFRAFDWGSAKPFSCGWYAISDGTWGLPKGALLKYREWYGCAGEPNTGLKLDAEVVGEGIALREEGEQIKYGVADPQIFVRDGGPSIGERMNKRLKQGHFRAGDRKRIVGWDLLRHRLQGEFDAALGTHLPMLYFLDCCDDSIRTIPVLPHDEHNAEDVDTDAEDHAGDETRYACMSRPWLPKNAPAATPVYPKAGPISLGQMTKDHLAKAAARREEMSLS